MNPYRAKPPPRHRGSWWQQLKCRLGWCFKELDWIEETPMHDVWHQSCPFCGASANAIDEGSPRWKDDHPLNHNNPRVPQPRRIQS